MLTVLVGIEGGVQKSIDRGDYYLKKRCCECVDELAGPDSNCTFCEGTGEASNLILPFEANIWLSFWRIVCEECRFTNTGENAVWVTHLAGEAWRRKYLPAIFNRLQCSQAAWTEEAQEQMQWLQEIIDRAAQLENRLVWAAPDERVSIGYWVDPGTATKLRNKQAPRIA